MKFAYNMGTHKDALAALDPFMKAHGTQTMPYIEADSNGVLTATLPPYLVAKEDLLMLALKGWCDGFKAGRLAR